MARFVVHVKSPRPPVEVFAFMADLRNFEVWDPGVVQVEQTEGDGGGSDSVFDVTVKGVPRPITLRYGTDRYEPSREIVASAESSIRWASGLENSSRAATFSGNRSATVAKS